MISSRHLFFAAVTALSCAAQAAVPPQHAQDMAKGLALFKSDVRAALTQHCLKCHGGEKVKGGLDLTTREGLLKGGEEGVVIVSGQSKASRLYKSITHATKPAMPDKSPKLPDALIAKIAQWIDYGAPYDKPLMEKGAMPAPREISEADRQFWSFQPLKKVSPPKVRDTKWPRNDVDRFILAKLDEKKLAPNAPADRRTLLRRVYLDLIGLPPTPAEIEAFVNDKSPDAYAKVVDRLLASPHYGERWARHWLDVARFAESHGFEQDYDRPHAYHYRDFVIKALNADMPYDQFVKWQVAGDELAPGNPLALMATGFLGAGVFPTQLTEKEFESARYDELDDMAGTLGTAMLGLTIGCARCHDHKFDPIPVRDYYRLVSTFSTTIRSEIEVDLASDTHAAAMGAWERKRRALDEQLAQFEAAQLPARFDVWAKKSQAELSALFQWLILDEAEVKSLEGSTFTRQPDGSLLLGGKNPDHDRWVFKTGALQGALTAVRVEALADESLKKKGPGRADNGNFSLTDFRVFAQPADGSKPRVPVKLARPRATFEQNNGGLSVASSIDGDPRATGWAVDPQFGKNHAALFEFDEPLSMPGGVVLTLEMDFFTNTRHAIGRPRVAVTTAPAPAPLAGAAQLQSILSLMKAAKNLRVLRLTDAQRLALQAMNHPLDGEWKALSKELEVHQAAKPKPALTKVQATSEGVKPMKHHADDRGFPHFYKETHFLKRGDVNQKGEVATQGFLQVLMRGGKTEKSWQSAPPVGSHTSHRRAALAGWMADTEHGAGHLLARVMVNRLWQHHFGRGLVATPSDFGAQGEKPTHPELLDFLADELIKNGWRLKPLHRLMLASAAYQQDARHDAAKAAKDPQNMLVWRHTPQRLEAEAIRDSVLAVSGRLDRTMFGPGTLDQEGKRRSIYFFIKRSKLVPTMQLFDAPEPLVGQGARPATVIAPQALLFMNSPQVRAAAKELAATLQKNAGAHAATVPSAYMTALGRAPAKEELAKAVAFVQAQVAAYQTAGRADAAQLALADFCQVLFGLNEFIYIE